MNVTITPTKVDGCKAEIIALLPTQSKHFDIEKAKTVRVTISARVYPIYPNRKYKTRTTEHGTICVTRLQDKELTKQA